MKWMYSSAMKLPRLRFIAGFVLGSLVFGTAAYSVNVDNSPEGGYLICYNTKTKVLTFPGKLSCPTGTKGLELGAQGEPGYDGIDGSDGYNGFPGAQGIQGLPGATGIQGLPGATGATGAKGDTGATGAAGAKGDTGATGAAGKDGANYSSSSLVKSLIAKVESKIYKIACGASIGTGFGVDVNLSADAKAKGYVGAVLTNYHVVKNCLAKSVGVTQYGRNLGGYAWTWDEVNDLALIVTIGKVEVLPVALSKPVRGDVVVAFGNPYGLEGSVSLGIVSNLDADTVITDAAIDSGNSGGPLVNENGEYIGINTWGWEGAQGSSHAIMPGVQCREILACPVDSNLLKWSR